MLKKSSRVRKIATGNILFFQKEREEENYPALIFLFDHTHIKTTVYTFPCFSLPDDFFFCIYFPSPYNIQAAFFF